MSSSTQLSARQRIIALLDDNSFVEIGALVTKRSTDFNLQEKSIPGDGVITGYGVIDGRLVYIYSQDAEALGGSIGEMHARKITRLYDMAMKVGAPVIGFIDSAGLRLQEATDALAGFGEIYFKQSMASGVIPQITAVFGNCGGSSAISASLSDFIFMEEKNGKLFVNTPNALEGNNITKCDTSGAVFKAKAGVADYIGMEEDVISAIHELISILPSNNEDDTPVLDGIDDINRLLPEFKAKLADPVAALQDLSDEGYFYELKSNYEKEMVTGFIRLNGLTVGVIANRTAELDENGKIINKLSGNLTKNGCYKAEKFIKICDAYGIPILTLTNAGGFSATICEEKGISIASARLIYAFANATVPKVNVITEKAYGSAYVAMNSKHIGADLVFALEHAEIGTMDAKMAVQIIYADEMKVGAGAKELLEQKASEYAALLQSAASAAGHGHIDAVIASDAVRKHLIYSFEMLYSKREERPGKKHGTV